MGERLTGKRRSAVSARRGGGSPPSACSPLSSRTPARHLLLLCLPANNALPESKERSLCHARASWAAFVGFLLPPDLRGPQFGALKGRAACEQPSPAGRAGRPGSLPRPLGQGEGLTGLSWVFRNAVAQPPGDDHLGLLVGLQRDLALETPTHSRLGSILGRGGADERTVCTEADVAAGGCGSRGAWPASPSLSFPLVGSGGLWGALLPSAICCCKRLCLLPSIQANCLSCLPLSLQLLLPPSPPRRSLKWVCRLQADV